MTYPFKFAGVDDPTVTQGEGREWGGVAARLVHATAGRHASIAQLDHRVIFYPSGPTDTDCSCDGLRTRRLQTPGDFDIVPSGYTGYWEDAAPTEIVAIRLSPALWDSTAEELGVPGKAELAPKLGARDPLVEHVVRALAADLHAPAPAGRIYAESLGVALATRLIQGFSTTAGPGRQTLSKPQVRRLVAFVEENLEGELTLAALAEAAQLSVPHLTTLFRRTMGQSLHAYVMERRVEKARSLLLAGKRSIAEVALETGFAHQSHLARWMRRLLGATPSEVVRAART